jgi:hypothetical protein
LQKQRRPNKRRCLICHALNNQRYRARQ